MSKPIMMRLGKSLIVLSIVLLVLTGCWDRQEIDERAVVLGIGIDEVKKTDTGGEEVAHLEGELTAPETPLIRATVQIAVPGQITLGPSTGGGGGGGLKTVWVAEAVGNTIDDAINVLQQKVASPLFFGHLRIIVVSEDVARKGIQNLNDYFRRNPDVRRLNWMIISKGEAAKIMKLSPQLERVPSLYLLTAMNESVKLGRFPNDFLGIFWTASSAIGKEGYLPYVKPKEGSTVEISGLAYFKGDKMVGSTKQLEITVFMGIAGMNPAGGHVFIKIPGSNDYVEYEARSRKAVTKVRIENGRPHVYVIIYIEGNIREKADEQVTISHEIIKQLEKELSDDAKKAYQGLIHKTQQQQSDIFGFGEYVRARQSGFWNANVKTKEKWQEIYKNLPVDVTVKISIRRVGMKAD